MPISNPHTFTTIRLDKLLETAQKVLDDGGRFVNLHATTVENGFELTYSFTRTEEMLDNYRIVISEDDVVPSITSIWLAAFVFENEIHDLFGIEIEGIAIDFEGNFYQVALDTPMKVETTENDMYAVEQRAHAYDDAPEGGEE